MKKLTVVFAMALMVVVLAASAWSAEGVNSRKGKYLFKKQCKACHNDDGSAANITPMSKTQSQWDRMFKKAKHKADQQAWDKHSEKDLKDMNQFLFDHAVDSDQPETCG